MKDLQELEILILELIDKHPTITDTYSLTRFFGKSSILPNRLYETLKYLIANEYLQVKEVKHTVNYYEVTTKGKTALDSIDVFEYLELFTIEIDKTAFICEIIFLLENKKNLVEIIESYLLNDERMIAFIHSNDGKLPDSMFLEDFQKKMWKIKSYIQIWGSIDTHDKIKQQEDENIFQYLIEGMGHVDKPEEGKILRITKTTNPVT